MRVQSSIVIVLEGFLHIDDPGKIYINSLNAGRSCSAAWPWSRHWPPRRSRRRASTVASASEVRTWRGPIFQPFAPHESENISLRILILCSIYLSSRPVESDGTPWTRDLGVWKKGLLSGEVLWSPILQLGPTESIPVWDNNRVVPQSKRIWVHWSRSSNFATTSRW